MQNWLFDQVKIQGGPAHLRPAYLWMSPQVRGGKNCKSVVVLGIFCTNVDGCNQLGEVQCNAMHSLYYHKLVAQLAMHWQGIVSWVTSLW